MSELQIKRREALDKPIDLKRPAPKSSLKDPLKDPLAKDAASRTREDSIAALLAGKSASGEDRGLGALRDEDAIANSGMLDEFKLLDGVEVPASEYDRTVDDDAVLVMQGLFRMTPEELATKKQEAWSHADRVADDKTATPKTEADPGTRSDSAASGYYGSDQHREWGALVEKLSGGAVSAEEAMAMNPSGGIAGPAMSNAVFRQGEKIGPIARHAMRHDATGFLETRFGVGPGYGSKTSAIGLDKDNCMAGQVLGIARETLKTPSELPEAGATATPGRFRRDPS